MATLLAGDVCPGRHPVLGRACLRLRAHEPMPCFDVEVAWWSEDLHDTGECLPKIDRQGHEINTLIEDNSAQEVLIDDLQDQISTLQRENDELRRHINAETDADE